MDGASEHLAAILDALPDTPGVYLHKDAEGRVLYVGKAKVLRQRVRSYFQPSADHTPRIAALVRQVREATRPAPASAAVVQQAAPRPGDGR